MNRSRVCVDANLVLRLMIPPKNPALEQLWDMWQGQSFQVVAPALLAYEVTNSLHRYRQGNVLSKEATENALQGILSLPIVLHTEADLHMPALRLARRYHLPAAYDAHYLALAQLHGIEFWTGDRKLARACSESWVKLVE